MRILVIFVLFAVGSFLSPLCPMASATNAGCPSPPSACVGQAPCEPDLDRCRAEARAWLLNRPGVVRERPMVAPLSPEVAGQLADRVRLRLQDLLSAGKLEAHLQQAVSKAQQDWLRALSRLEARLKIAGDTAEGWRLYLDWPALEKLARQKDGDWPEAVLEKAYRKLAAGHPGLELGPFVELRVATQHLLLRRAALSDRQLADQIKTVGEQLADLLPRLAEDPSSDNLLVFYQLTAWFGVLGLSEVLLPEANDYFVGPNVRTLISERLIQAVIDRPVDDVSPVWEVILGTELSGTGRTRGELRASLLPDETAGVIRLSMAGVVTTKATGVNGPVRVLTRGRTDITAEKLLALGRSALVAAPAYSHGVTESQIDSLWAVRGGAFVESIAWRRAWSQKPLAEWIAARRAEYRLNSRLDRDIDARLKELHQRFERRVFDPLEERGLYPQLVSWRTTATHLEGWGWVRGILPLAAPAAVPEIPADADLAVAVHDSTVNVAVAECLSGMILREMELRDAAKDFFGTVPAWMEVEDPAEPWTIFLARERPVEVSFSRGKMRVTLRGRSYEKGGRSYPGMDVSAEYRLELSPQGPVAVREGDLQIYPPGFEKDKQRLSAREQVLRTLLERRFAKVFPPEWQAPVLKWRPAQPGFRAEIELRPIGWQAADGWFVLAWKLVD